MRTILSFFFILACSFFVIGQNPNGDYNPYVGSSKVDPSPISSVQLNGVGTISFEAGNTGGDPLNVYDDQYITLTLTFSHGEPDAANPVNAITGTAAGFFSWSYDDGTYTAKQVSSIPAGFSGTVTIAYKVTENSASPGINGFNVNISPAPYQTNSNSQSDDAVSFYTYTMDDNNAPSAPTGVSLVSISEESVTITWNASSGVNGIEGYIIYRDDSVVGETIDLQFTDSTVTPGVSYLYAVSAVDSTGHEGELSAPLSVLVLSVNDFRMYQLHIKPNPSNGLFQINLDSAYGEFIMEIVSAAGNIVIQRTIQIQPQSHEIIVNLDFLDTGIYTIRIFNQHRVYYGKLMIIH